MAGESMCFVIKLKSVPGCGTLGEGGLWLETGEVVKIVDSA
jgi:hypothetical protein